MGPMLGNITLPTPHSCLCEDTYLTNKHNNLIKWSSITQNTQIDRIKTMEFFIKEDILTPHGPHNREYDVTYPHSYLNQGTYFATKHSHFKVMKI